MKARMDYPATSLPWRPRAGLAGRPIGWEKR